MEADRLRSRLGDMGKGGAPMSAPKAAEHFLACLDPKATWFSFQTFDDNQERKDRKLARIFHGTLTEHAAELARLNAKGAGIFVTVNETNGKGRTKADIVRVRAVFVDLDGAPLDPVMEAGSPPHIVTQTSAGKWHAYWRVDGMPLETFSEVQKSLIARFNSDPAVHDLPRVMRLPGFEHRKEKPFLVSLKSANDHAAYSPADVQSLRTPTTGKEPPACLRDLKMNGRGIAIDGPTPWQMLNAEALSKLDAWVPALFKDAEKKGNGVYRVTSKALGRDLEEDLSISPQGIKDFGVHDLGDKRQGRRTPLDLVMEYGGAKNLPQAVEWLGERLGHPKAEPLAEPTSQEATKDTTINATPFVWTDPKQIPKRRWLYKPHYVRQFVSLTVSTGGVGKSSLIIVEALALVTGKSLLNIKPERQLRVWYWNGEDPMEELQRRFAAALKHYCLAAEDIGDRLFVDSGRTMPIVIAEDRRYDMFIAEPVVDEVIATIDKNQIDVVIIDPFVTCHRVNENDNSAIERVAKSWSHVADDANCSVMLVHHSRKVGSGEGGVTVDDGRGASALLAAARSARALNTMRDREAQDAEIEERERRLYFRADGGKTNLTRPPEVADWFKLISVDLENPGEADWDTGDQVGVVTMWTYPKATEPKTTGNDIARAQDAISIGGPWRADQRAKNEPWVGIPIAEVLGLSLLKKSDKRAVVKMVDDWLRSGLLKRVDRRDRHHETHAYVEVSKKVTDLMDKARG